MDSLQELYMLAKTSLLKDSIYKLIENKGIEVYQNFIKDYPNSLVSSYTISDIKSRLGYEKTKQFFELLSEENKQSVYGKNIQKYIELRKKTDIGQIYTDFEMKDSRGSLRSLSEFDGKVILLEFWASWCAPCRQENPNLIKTYNKYHPKGFEIFAVSLDDNEDEWKKAIEQDNLPWTQLSDLEGRNNIAALIYEVNGIPDNYLIDQNGVIIGHNLRGEKLIKKLTKLLE